MRRPKLVPRLLAELVEREAVVYRLCLREAVRLSWGPPAAALRALVAHANESLEELHPLARARHVGAGSARALALDAVRRVRERLVDQLPVADEGPVARALAAVRASLDCARALRSAAADAGDVALARWSERWLFTRKLLATEATSELAGAGPVDHVGVRRSRVRAGARPPMRRALDRGSHAFQRRGPFGIPQT